MNLLQEMGVKELEYVVLKARDSITMGNKIFLPDEPVMYFKNLQIATLNEDTRLRVAEGGYLNLGLIFWEERNNVVFEMTNGTMNQISFNMLLNAHVLEEEEYYAPYKQNSIVNYGQIFLDHKMQLDKPHFFYKYSYGNIQEKIKPITESEDLVTFSDDLEGVEILCDYYFKPKIDIITYTMDKQRNMSLFKMEAVFYFKDENSGNLHTGIITMPKVYLRSGINLRMGEQADPAIANFSLIAMPDKDALHETWICKIAYMNSDIYAI